MEKRAVERLPANLQIRMFYGNMVYTGMVINLSEEGTFISTKLNFPVDSMFIVVVLQNDQTFKIPVRVRRTVKTDSHHSYKMNTGMGVKLIDPPEGYLDFVRLQDRASGNSFD